jgi:hypothetical protein
VAAVATSAVTETVAVASAARGVAVVVPAVLPEVVVVLVPRLLKCSSSSRRQAEWHDRKFLRRLAQMPLAQSVWVAEATSRKFALSRNRIESNVCMIQGLNEATRSGHETGNNGVNGQKEISFFVKCYMEASVVLLGRSLHTTTKMGCFDFLCGVVLAFHSDFISCISFPCLAVCKSFVCIFYFLLFAKSP